MTNLTWTPCALLALAFPTSALQSGDEVELLHAPRAGATRSIAIEARIEMNGGELECVMDGEDVPSEYLPELNLQTTDVRKLEVTETYEEEGWLRSYDAVAWENDGSMSMGQFGNESSFPWSSVAASPIEGRVVRLTPEEDGSFAREFADEGGEDAALLAELHAGLGLAVLLPDGPATEGDTWTVDGSDLGVLFDPCGDLRWDLPAEAAQYMLPEIRSREHGGDLELRLREVVDGGTQAHCDVVGVLTRTTEQPGDLSQVPVADGEATDTVTESWKVEGTLVWNLDSNTLLTLDLEGDFRQDTVTVRDPDQPGSTYESTFTVPGTYQVLFESVAVEADR